MAHDNIANHPLLYLGLSLIPLSHAVGIWREIFFKDLRKQNTPRDACRQTF